MRRARSREAFAGPSAGVSTSDIKDIFDWIVSESNYPSIAENLVNRIYDRCETLGEFPLKGRARNDLQPGIRILAFERKAVIAYHVVADEVEVTNIFYGGRDWEAIMSDTTDDNQNI